MVKPKSGGIGLRFGRRPRDIYKSYYYETTLAAKSRGSRLERKPSYEVGMKDEPFIELIRAPIEPPVAVYQTIEIHPFAFSLGLHLPNALTARRIFSTTTFNLQLEIGAIGYFPKLSGKFSFSRTPLLGRSARYLLLWELPVSTAAWRLKHPGSS